MIHTGVESALRPGTVRASLASTIQVLSLVFRYKIDAAIFDVLRLFRCPLI
jgi:hypothetical protein